MQQSAAPLAKTRAGAIPAAARWAGNIERAQRRQSSGHADGCAPLRQLLREAAHDLRQVVDRARRLIARHRIIAAQSALPPPHTRFYHVYQFTQIERVAADL
jgi:hypothetical protein